MNRSDFDFILPEDLIAQTPMPDRERSRLLCLNRQTGETSHRWFFELPELLRDGDCLVLNDSRVLPARLIGRRETGGAAEILLLRELGEPPRNAPSPIPDAKPSEAGLCQRGGATERSGCPLKSGRRAAQSATTTWECLARPGRRIKPGTRLFFSDGELTGTITDEAEDGNKIIRFEYDGIFLEVLERLGKMPLPHYIHETLEDSERYQTVYSRESGSAAAPTAGLHFTFDLLEEIRSRGVDLCYVTLHVGLGTFRPVKADIIEEHRMHEEFFILPDETAAAINRTKERGGRVIAVGTTSCRTLETCAEKSGAVSACSGYTDAFIYPGYSFKCIDGLITNFHLPESTLIMLVSAFAGRENVLRAYEEAIREKYRFYSFGDAMLII